jgi:hypothetical protein
VVEGKKVAWQVDAAGGEGELTGSSIAPLYSYINIYL